MKYLAITLFLLLVLLMAVAPARSPSAMAHTLGTTAAPRPLGNEWFLARVGAQVAWAKGADGQRTNGDRIKVLVIDTGLDPAATQMFSATVLPSWSFSQHYSAHQDSLGHGTFVVSEIAGSGGNGYYGVCPQCSVAVARVFGAGDGASSADIARAIDWGVAHGFEVMNMSLGGPQDDPVLRASVARAAAAGVVLVCAAGNDGAYNINYPAGDPGCLAVSATNYQDRVTSWSTFGPDVQLSAPGELIAGYLPLSANGIGGYGFATISGTSMAAPIVTGAVADLLSLGLAPKVAIAALKIGARQPKSYSPALMGAGEVDLAGALRVLGKP
jgi:subtilisin family serine protease